MRSLTSLSIKSKLIVMLLAVSSCSILVTAYLGYRSGQLNLTNRVFNQLTSVRASKAYQIESYFQNIRNHTQTLSEDPSVIAAIQEFTSAYNQLQNAEVQPTFDDKLTAYYRDEFLTRLTKVEEGSPILESYLPHAIASRYLQHHYIAANPNPVGKKDSLNNSQDNSEYSKIHARYHPIFRKIIQKFGYYDMFLIDPQGNIVYTVFKETDFATNLEKDAYKDSNLAKLYRMVRESKTRDYTKIVDFAPYSPSYGAPAAFIAAPIYNQSELIGVLAFQLPVNEINNVMTGNRNWERDGLGKTGETYLVGRDALMRSVSRFLVQDPQGYAKTLRSLGVSEAEIDRINQYQTSILQQYVRTEAVADALTGKQGTRIIKDYRNIPVLSSYAPLRIEGLDWVILSEMDLSEAYSPIYSFRYQILISATLLMLLVTLLAMALANLFVKPINQLISSTRKVAQGKLDAITPLQTEDEFGELANSINQIVQSLRIQSNLVEQKNRENEQLFLSIFPTSVAKRFQRGEKEIAEDVANVAVLFSDLSGFSKLSSSLSASESVAILNDLVTAFDEAADRYGLEKIKTIGDSYLAVCGLSIPYLDHEKRAIDVALEMLMIVRRFNHERGLQLNIQIGVNSGDIIAGIVGRNRFIYDVWGDTINVAAALKYACPPGGILVSHTVYRRLQDLYQFEPMTNMETNGKSKLNAWLLKSTLSPVEIGGS
ncbi:adenylate/guanylate cyclase domain-containing protein [Phormidium sp. LEGE 05292]|uniref:adenylate/guanylate cyclase domain-containing protein n=1 Tax=[Phormidium] sp. LEGE 05292 TaxID=767427 RepID=UPI001881F4E9|nr:adenylate/guanylate cyclase domain-containing protein [Phormidium sp. LEGE 05292]MBE9228997.1 adenylate/guanylate cyclase domain-containing protein [Phormidium sp. LEGE 05292]